MGVSAARTLASGAVDAVFPSDDEDTPDIGERRSNHDGTEADDEDDPEPKPRRT